MKQKTYSLVQSLKSLYHQWNFAPMLKMFISQQRFIKLIFYKRLDLKNNAVCDLVWVFAARTVFVGSSCWQTVSLFQVLISTKIVNLQNLTRINTTNQTHVKQAQPFPTEPSAFSNRTDPFLSGSPLPNSHSLFLNEYVFNLVFVSSQLVHHWVWNMNEMMSEAQMQLIYTYNFTTSILSSISSVFLL